MKSILLISSILLTSSAFADIQLNENILTNCRIDQNGVMNGCVAREEAIAGISAFEQRKDLKFKYKIDYNYSCNANRLTDINIVSESDNLTLGKFRYLGGSIEGEANSRLVIKDFSQLNTGRAKYNAACKLEITKISQDLSSSSIETIKRDICSMKRQNDTSAQSEILLYLAQSLLNNVGTLSIQNLENQLNKLKKNLNIMKRIYTNTEIVGQIDDIVGNQQIPVKGSINNIIANAAQWGQGSQELVQNLNYLYNNMQTIQYSLGLKIDDNVKRIFNSNKDLIYINKLPSVPELYSNLMFEHKILVGESTENYNQAEYCQ